MPFYGKIRFSFLDSKLPRAPSPLWFRGPLGQLPRPGGGRPFFTAIVPYLGGESNRPI